MSDTCRAKHKQSAAYRILVGDISKIDGTLVVVKASRVAGDIVLSGEEETLIGSGLEQRLMGSDGNEF